MLFILTVTDLSHKERGHGGKGGIACVLSRYIFFDLSSSFSI